jgi:hypothetical protein
MIFNLRRHQVVPNPDTIILRERWVAIPEVPRYLPSHVQQISMAVSGRSARYELVHSAIIDG